MTAWQEEAEKHPAWPYFVAALNTSLDKTWPAELLEFAWVFYRVGWAAHEGDSRYRRIEQQKAGQVPEVDGLHNKGVQ